MIVSFPDCIQGKKMRTQKVVRWEAILFNSSMKVGGNTAPKLIESDVE